MTLNKKNILFSATLLIALSFLLLTGCGSPPEGPGIEAGSISIWAYFDSSWTDAQGVLHPDSVLVPSGDTIIVEVDGDSNRIYYSVVNPVTIADLLPGEHKFDIAWEDFNTSFSSDISEAETTTVSPKMTQFAPDFTLPGMFFDQVTDTLASDTVILRDYRGKVVLLFYFNAGWAECKGREIPAIDDSIHSVYPDSLVECLGICGGTNISVFLANYIQGIIPYYPWTTEFTILYNAAPAEAAYNFIQPSTWVVIDKYGKISLRMDNYTEYDAVSIMIDKIEELLLEP